MAVQICYDKFLELLNNRVGGDDISQHKLAKKSGVDNSTISKIMSGTNVMSFQVFAKLCVALDVDPFEYLQNNGDKVINMSRIPADKKEKIMKILAED